MPDRDGSRAQVRGVSRHILDDDISLGTGLGTLEASVYHAASLSHCYSRGLGSPTSGSLSMRLRVGRDIGRARRAAHRAPTPTRIAQLAISHAAVSSSEVLCSSASAVASSARHSSLAASASALLSRSAESVAVTARSWAWTSASHSSADVALATSASTAAACRVSSGSDGCSARVCVRCAASCCGCSCCGCTADDKAVGTAGCGSECGTRVAV